ncbi:MAG: hypothetical protein LBG61_02730 [Burkholderiales bacterium]|jgi:hypothetical protein|nr:hypothetical protein [Burkholderiales bacterium]
MTRNFIETMRDAAFVFINGEIFQASYVRVPDETTVPDDIVLEATRDNSEVELTRLDIDQAVALNAGFFKLKSGMVVRFLPASTLH